MRKSQQAKWQKLTITPEDVMSKLEPGMSIFLGTGVGEPRTLVKAPDGASFVPSQGS